MISRRTFAETLNFDLHHLDLDWIVIPKAPRNDEKVKTLAESYRVTGVRAPLAVRLVAHRTKPNFLLGNTSTRWICGRYGGFFL